MINRLLLGRIMIIQAWFLTSSFTIFLKYAHLTRYPSQTQSRLTVTVHCPLTSQPMRRSLIYLDTLSHPAQIASICHCSGFDGCCTVPACVLFFSMPEFWRCTIRPAIMKAVHIHIDAQPCELAKRPNS
ncbi:hypothetical protein BJX76DRAFT_34490 [Aspergillus varians]